MTTTTDRHGPEPHGHEHHGHEHHGHEAGTPPAGGPVVVDIGGDIGALIVRLDRDLLGTELHLCQDGWDHTVHTGVWDRRLGDRLVTVAVYPGLVEGRYQILDRTGGVWRTATVEGSRVTELDLRR